MSPPGGLLPFGEMQIKWWCLVSMFTRTLITWWGGDEVGRELVSWSSGTRTRDCGALIARDRSEFPSGPVWTPEDCRYVSGRLERALLNAAGRCLRVPPKMMSAARQSARTQGKSDPIDALAVARTAMANLGPPVAEHAHVSHELKLLVDHRQDLLGSRKRAEHRLRWHLQDLDPDLETGIPGRSLNAEKFLEPMSRHLSRLPQTTQVHICRELVNDITDLTGRSGSLKQEISSLVREQAPDLLGIPGCGALTAARLLTETGNPARFPHEAYFTMHSGVGDSPSSGRTNCHRLARGGNRQLSTAMHRIAVSQIRLDGPSRIDHQHRRKQGDTAMDALHFLKRKIAGRVSKKLNTPDTAATATHVAVAVRHWSNT